MRSRDPFASQSRSAVNGSPLSEKSGKSGRTKSELVGSSVSQDRDPAQEHCGMTAPSRVNHQGSTVLRQELQARRKAPKIVGGRKAGKYIPGRRAGKNHARTQGPLRGERSSLPVCLRRPVSLRDASSASRAKSAR